MSVIVTVWAMGDPEKLERVAGENPDRMRKIADQGKEHGVVGHRIYGTDDGQIMAIDEWPDEQSFESFFTQAGPDIQAVLSDAGVTSEPQVRFWRKLDTKDDVGWSA
jgi:hypothetical protein